MSDQPGLALRVIGGSPTPEELAAVVAVLSALAGARATSSDGRTTSRWSAPASRLRTAFGPRPGGWRASGMPR